ncbi:MAG: hypothetical protein E2O68_01095 [Deltaproteobacteria bacterium]|nr:MAG: hypothetical protein E2O68_01095 [Deltaproteobacteria bacterium]
MDAYNKAIKLLSKQDYSEPRLRQKLQTAGMSDEMIQSAILKLKEQNLLKESAFIDSFVRKHMRKGFSISYIKEKLERDNITVDEERIKVIFESEDLTHSKQIKNLIDKKTPSNFRHIDRQKLINRLIRHLHSKGHNIDDGLSYLETML